MPTLHRVQIASRFINIFHSILSYCTAHPCLPCQQALDYTLHWYSDLQRFFFKEEKKSQFCVATTYVYITYQGPRITGKLLCPISIISICGTEGEVKLKLSAFKTLSPIYSFLYQCPGSVVVNSLNFRAGDWGSNNFQNTFFFFSSFQGHQTFLFKISNLSNHFPIKGSERRVISPINGLSQKLTY